MILMHEELGRRFHERSGKRLKDFLPPPSPLSHLQISVVVLAELFGISGGSCLNVTWLERVEKYEIKSWGESFFRCVCLERPQVAFCIFLLERRESLTCFTLFVGEWERLSFRVRPSYTLSSVYSYSNVMPIETNECKFRLRVFYHLCKDILSWRRKKEWRASL
jgi:hypothetical protein